MSDELVVTGLARRFGARPVLRDVSFRAGLGVTAVVGRNGAGKTTLFSILAGILRADAGAIQFGNRGATGPTVGVGLMPQFAEVVRWLDVRDYVRYAVFLAGGTWLGSRGRAEGLLDRVGLIDHSRTRTTALSGGQRRALALACALAGDPSVLLLDEPTAGLDPVERRAMLSVIAGLARDRIVLMSTHSTDDVDAAADRYLILRDGRTETFDSRIALITAAGCDEAEAADGAVLRDAVAVLLESGSRPAS